MHGYDRYTRKILKLLLPYCNLLNAIKSRCIKIKEQNKIIEVITESSSRQQVLGAFCGDRPK